MYHHIFVAGTFDGIHKGHEVLLARAFLDGKRVIIGLTPDDFVKKFKTSKIRDLGSRKKELEDWLRQKQFMSRTSIITIKDAHEPAASIPKLDAIVVSAKTAFRAREINDIRKKRGLSELAVLEVPMIDAEDRKPISSTRLRNGEIDGEGRLVMPDNLRPELAKPLGTVLGETAISSSIERNRQKSIITVGDIATETLIKHGVTPSLSIIDQKVGRKPYDTLKNLPNALLGHRTNVVSGPGYIAQEAIKLIEKWTKDPKTTLLVVDGEEDLLALPAIHHAPEGSVVYYGQPQEGLVEVMVTEEKKREVVALIDKFIQY